MVDGVIIHHQAVLFFFYLVQNEKISVFFPTNRFFIFHPRDVRIIRSSMAHHESNHPSNIKDERENKRTNLTNLIMELQLGTGTQLLWSLVVPSSFCSLYLLALLTTYYWLFVFSFVSSAVWIGSLLHALKV